jgi:hypothetical protein
VFFVNHVEVPNYHPAPRCGAESRISYRGSKGKFSEWNLEENVSVWRIVNIEEVIPMFDQQKKQQIASALERKGVNRPCERCGSQNFSILDGYFRQDVQDDLTNVNLGGPSVPTVSLVCENCGNLSFFAVRALLPNES